MPRHQYKKLTVPPDPVYGSFEVAKLINYVSRDGKKSISEKYAKHSHISIKKAMKETVKKARLLKMERKNEEAKNLLSLAYQAIDKAAKRGVIKKNAASRKKSRLAKFINKI